MNPTPEQLALAQRNADGQLNQLFNSDISRDLRSGKLAQYAEEQDAADIREIDAWMVKQ